MTTASPSASPELQELLVRARTGEVGHSQLLRALLAHPLWLLPLANDEPGSLRPHSLADASGRQALPLYSSIATLLDAGWGHRPYCELTPAKAFGTLYVMEGATLGGQVINRHLKEHLGLTPENGGVFFNGYGQMTGPMWKAFGASIEAFAASANADDEIVAAAKDAFTSFKQCFEEPLEFSQAGA